LHCLDDVDMILTILFRPHCSSLCQTVILLPADTPGFFGKWKASVGSLAATVHPYCSSEPDSRSTRIHRPNCRCAGVRYQTGFALSPTAIDIISPVLAWLFPIQYDVFHPCFCEMWLGRFVVAYKQPANIDFSLPRCPTLNLYLPCKLVRDFV
jgi:hypothetical protein